MTPELLKLVESRYRLDRHKVIAWCLSEDSSGDAPAPGDPQYAWQGRVLAVYNGEEFRFEYQERYPSGRAPVTAIGGWTHWDNSSRDDDGGHTRLKPAELVCLVQAITNYANGEKLVAV
ncbi:MAG: hypothetical protein ACTSX8_03525 [Alphaproteobacteria bacterium]